MKTNVSFSIELRFNFAIMGKRLVCANELKTPDRVLLIFFIKYDLTNLIIVSDTE